MAEKLRRYEKIDFLGEGQVRFYNCYNMKTIKCMLYIMINMPYNLFILVCHSL